MGTGATIRTSGICEQVVAGCGELWRVVGELWQARTNGDYQSETRVLNSDHRRKTGESGSWMH